ncbi:MAG: tRNA (adenosine(37)-N6)-threonylcarbamoyltransferase complex ATPase subunit type 1 TsaE [Paracoccaceae bacterium]
MTALSDPAQRTFQTRFASAEDTAGFAVALGAGLGPGDTVLLTGDIGAGKTHFARALIQSRLLYPEDVPSPTFTLVQVYDAEGAEVWHCDLYRLTAPEQVIELGLDEAMDHAICLIEWPDRLGDMTPAHALSLSFCVDPQNEAARMLTAYWTAPRWDAVLDVE